MTCRLAGSWVRSCFTCPPAGVYTGSCAVGRAWPPRARFPDASELRVSLRVVRNGAGMFSDTVNVTGLCRRPAGRVRGLSGVLGFPVGVVLLTGTAIVPPPGFIGRGGDEMIMALAGLGEVHDVVGVAGL